MIEAMLTIAVYAGVTAVLCVILWRS